MKRPTNFHHVHSEAWDEDLLEDTEIDDSDAWTMLRLVCKLLSVEALQREGDLIIGASGAELWLDTRDAHTLRQLEDAVIAADEKYKLRS